MDGGATRRPRRGLLSSEKQAGRGVGDVDEQLACWLEEEDNKMQFFAEPPEGIKSIYRKVLFEEKLQGKRGFGGLFEGIKFGKKHFRKPYEKCHFTMSSVGEFGIVFNSKPWKPF